MSMNVRQKRLGARVFWGLAIVTGPEKQ